MAVISAKSATKVIRGVLSSLNETTFTPKSTVLTSEALVDQEPDALERVIRVMELQEHVIADENGGLKLTGSGVALLATIPNRRTT